MNAKMRIRDRSILNNTADFFTFFIYFNQYGYNLCKSIAETKSLCEPIF